VVLTDLGRIYFDKVVGNLDLLKSSPPANIAGKQVKPVVRVFVRRALVGALEQQTVYVIVQDQYLRPLEGAQIGVTLHFPDEGSEFYRLPESNEFGISQFSFTTPDLAVQSILYIDAEVSIRGETASGKSWFRIWW
jgi:hypothetical protein